MNYKLLNYIFAISGSFMIFFFILINVVYFYPYNIIDIKYPMVITEKIVKKGDILTYIIDYDKHYNIPESISQQLLVNHGDKTFSNNYASIHKNLKIDKNVIKMNVVIPNNTFDGEAKLRVTLRYKFFWDFRVIDITKETENFQVVGVTNVKKK